MTSDQAGGRLAGKVVIITGAAGTLGREFTTRFAAEGASVVVADLNREGGEALVAQVVSDGGRAIYSETDITSEESAQATVKLAVDTYGGLDSLVNNAALMSEKMRRPFEMFSADEWLKMLQVNVVGPAMMMKAARLELAKRTDPSIVNLASSTIFNGGMNMSPYVASKGGVLAMSRAVAREFGDLGIRVNVVTPGLVDPRGVNPDIDGGVAGQGVSVAGRCLKRVAAPDDLVGAVLFLCSDDSRFISGQTINVDGGFNMN